MYGLFFPEAGTQGMPLITLTNENGQVIAAQGAIKGQEEGIRMPFCVGLQMGHVYTLTIDLANITNGGYVCYLNAPQDTDNTLYPAIINGQEQSGMMFTQFTYLRKTN